MRALITEKFSRPPSPRAPSAVSGLREAAVLLPLIDRRTGMTLLLAQRTLHLHHHPGQISLPGGMIEDTDANAVAAALRETHEEVGIGPDQVEVIGELMPIDTRTGFRITPVVGFVGADVEFVLDRFEVEHVFEVPLEFLLNAANYQRQSKTFPGFGEVRYYVLDYRGQIIWGATAQILVNFARHLGVDGIPDV
jgi:8-oxo-dGTP pyrophosphatase MutT (NUDIX family)